MDNNNYGYNNNYGNYGNNFNNDYNNSNKAPEQGKGKSIASMACGIASIVFSFCYGIPGIILAIVSLCLQGSYKSMNNNTHNGFSKAGFICGLIGLILSILMTIIYTIIIVGAVNIASNSPQFNFNFTY